MTCFLTFYKEDLRPIRNAFKQYRDATAPDQGRMLMLKDAQFHLKIIEYSRNKIIYAYLKDILEQIYLRYKPEYLLKDKVKEAFKEHRAIFSALGQGDTARTQALISDHIQKGKGHIIHNLRSSQKLFFQETP